MVNPLLTGYDTESRRKLQGLPEKSPIPGKWKNKLLLKIDRKESKKTKKFLKTTRVDEPEPSVQSQQAKPGQETVNNYSHLKILVSYLDNPPVEAI